MATLADVSVPPKPLHPIMPPYAMGETQVHPSELNLQVEQPRIPKIWDSPSLGTNYHVEWKFNSMTTMVIRTMAASHATTLPTSFTLPLAKASNTWQHNNIDIAQGVDHIDASQQNDTQYSMHICSNNLQTLAMIPPGQLMNQGNTGQPDGLQCQGSGNQPMHTNNITTAITPTSNHIHADIPNPFYKKTRKSHSTIIPAPVQQL